MVRNQSTRTLLVALRRAHLLPAIFFLRLPTSAKENLNVDDAMNTLLKAIFQAGLVASAKPVTKEKETEKVSRQHPFSPSLPNLPFFLLLQNKVELQQQQQPKKPEESSDCC